MKESKNSPKDSDYVLFQPEDYVDNPVALARIKAHVTQEKLAKRINVTQAYINEIEGQDEVATEVLEQVSKVLADINKSNC